MTTVVLRSEKGTRLSHAELDANFQNLNNDKAEKSAVACYVSDTAPSVPAGQKYLWIQTGMGASGQDFTFWIGS